MKVYMLPRLADMGREESGIKRVIEAYLQYLPAHGFEFVDRPEDAELRVSHAGAGIGVEVVHCHGLYWTADYPASNWEWAVNRDVIEACRRAKAITVPSDWVAETFRRDMRLAPYIVPHGIEWRKYEPRKERAGHVLWNKNRIGDVCDPAPLIYLAAQFENVDFITTFAKGPVTPNVRVTGLQPHGLMMETLANAGVYLATTKETFGIGILEAMALGVPVLGFNHGGVVEMVEHLETGYLAQPGDYQDLAEGLRYCLEEGPRLGANGREAVKQFTWEKVAKKVAAIYRLAAKEEEPTAAIIIPCYNYEKIVGRAIESARAQTYPLLTKIIVIDDGSDNPEAVKRAVKEAAQGDARVMLVRQENSGVAIARNTGIAAAGTKYVACLDADDAIGPRFMEVCIEALEADRSLGIAYTGLRWIKPDGTTGISRWPADWDYDQQLRRRNQVPTCCVFRREMWERLGGYKARYAPKGAGSEDAEFWTRAGAYGWAAKKVTAEPLFVYSWLSGRVSGNEEYREVDWLAWHPWVKDQQHPFASYATPRQQSHPVREYDEPLISVIIPVSAAHVKTLADSLDSLEAQTFRRWEAVVVDDSGENIVDRYKVSYPYVRWVRTEEKAGAGKARNLGVDNARANLIVFLDADDWLYPEALEVMLEAFNDEPAIIYTDYVGKAKIDNPDDLADDLKERIYYHDERTGDAVIGFRSADYDPRVCQHQPPEHGQPLIWALVTCLYPKAWHYEIGGFDESMDSWEDVDYHWRLAKAGKCYVRVPQELAVVRFYTGTRRDLGVQKHRRLISYLRKKYEEIEVMGCGCGARKTYNPRRPALPRAVPTNTTKEASMQDGEFVLAKYLHPNRGKHRVIGGNTKIDYGRRAGGETFLVHVNDVQGQPHLFQRIEQPQPAPKPITPAAPPKVEAEVYEPEPIEISTELEIELLPGVTPKIAEALREAGFDNAEAIISAGEGGLQEVKGIGPTKAKQIYEAVSLLARSVS